MAVRARRPQPPSSFSSPSKPDRIQVPTWDLDPIWSLAPWPVTVQFGSVEVEVPAMSAAEWLAVLMVKELGVGDLMELVPDVNEVILDSDVDLEEVGDILLDMLTTVSGRYWWITLRLIGVARTHWDTIGPEMITSLNASQVSLAAWMNVLQLTLIRHMSPESVPMFVAQVQTPPPGTQAPETHRQDLTAREFLAIAG